MKTFLPFQFDEGEIIPVMPLSLVQFLRNGESVVLKSTMRVFGGCIRLILWQRQDGCFVVKANKPLMLLQAATRERNTQKKITQYATSSLPFFMS